MSSLAFAIQWKPNTSIGRPTRKITASAIPKTGQAGRGMRGRRTASSTTEAMRSTAQVGRAAASIERPALLRTTSGSTVAADPTTGAVNTTLEDSSSARTATRAATPMTHQKRNAASEKRSASIVRATAGAW
jgi:hypothetical protein